MTFQELSPRRAIWGVTQLEQERIRRSLNIGTRVLMQGRGFDELMNTLLAVDGSEKFLSGRSSPEILGRATARSMVDGFNSLHGGSSPIHS